MKKEMFMLKIAVIGGGPASVSLCVQLFHKLEKLNINQQIEVIVFEKNTKIGYGLPYLNINDCHILNLPKDIMEPMPGEKYIFSNWLKQKNSDFNDNEFPPRHYFGKYLEDRATEIQKKSKKIGLNIKYLTEHEVLNIEQINSHNNIVYTNKQYYSVNYIVLSTGHMPSTSYTDLIGNAKYIHNPWDDNLFSQINPNATIGILGTRLTAIDVLLKLENNNHKGKIYMASRSGLLPAVLSKNIASYELKYLNIETLQNLSKVNPKSINLNIILDLFWKELSHATGNNDNFNTIAKSSRDISPLEWLNREIKGAESGNRAWQNLLFALYPTTPYIWHMLNTEDKSLFLDKYFSLFLTYLAAFPLENAYKIRDIIMSYQLEIHGGLHSVSHSENNFVLSFDNNRLINVDYLFNATGPGYDATSLPLYQNMLNQQLIEKNPLGGIKIKPSTLQIIDKNNAPNSSIFAIGELAKGDYFLTTDLGSIVFHSDKVSEFIIKEILTIKNNYNNLTSAISEV